jgi:hypothetical protein
MEVSGQLYALAALPPVKEPLVPIGWAPAPVWTQWWREKFQSPAGTRTPDYPARIPALYHWATPAPKINDLLCVKYGLFFRWDYNSLVFQCNSLRNLELCTCFSAPDGGHRTVSHLRALVGHTHHATYWLRGWMGAPQSYSGYCDSEY